MKVRLLPVKSAIYSVKTYREYFETDTVHYVWSVANDRSVIPIANKHINDK